MTGEKGPTTEPEPMTYVLTWKFQPHDLRNRSHSLVCHRRLSAGLQPLKTHTLESGTCVVDSSRQLACCTSPWAWCITTILIKAQPLCLSLFPDDDSYMLSKHRNNSSQLASVCETFDMPETPSHSGIFKTLVIKISHYTVISNSCCRQFVGCRISNSCCRQFVGCRIILVIYYTYNHIYLSPKWQCSGSVDSSY